MLYQCIAMQVSHTYYRLSTYLMFTYVDYASMLLRIHLSKGTSLSCWIYFSISAMTVSSVPKGRDPRNGSNKGSPEGIPLWRGSGVIIRLDRMIQ